MSENGLIQKTTASSQIDWMYAIDGSADQIVQSLPTRTDEEVSEIRNSARALGRAAWRIEAACDAVILDRVKLRGGRGQKDTEGVGVDAAVRQVAHDLNVTPRTIYQNAAIHKTFFADQPNEDGTSERAISSFDHLEEKEFFKAALRSPDPHETIELLARKKAEDPNFSTRDAWQLVKPRHVPELTAILPAITLDDEGQRIWSNIWEHVKAFATKYPATRQTLFDALDEVKYIVEIPAQAVQERIINVIQNLGINELDPIADFLREDREVVRVWLNRMIDDDVLTSRIQTMEERVPGARGPARTYYDIA